MENNPMHRETGSYKFMVSPRCGAKTRKKTSCLAPAIKGKQRCRMHGGRGSGAPRCNKNAEKHGFHSKKEIKMRYFINNTIKDCSVLMEKIKSYLG